VSRNWALGAVGDRWDDIPSRHVALRSLGQVVYAIRTADGLIKIGSTADLDNRLKWYTATHGEHELLCFIPGALVDERALHDRFVAHRAHGREWYYPTPEILDWINTNRQQLGLDPVAA
jgi:hypothetical protein